MSRVGFGLALAVLAGIAAWMALTGKLQAMIGAAKSPGGQPPGAMPASTVSGALPPADDTSNTPDSGQAAGGASGSWATPNVPAPINTAPPAPATDPNAGVVKVATSGGSVSVPATIPVFDFSKLLTAAFGTDGVKATPYVPPKTGTAA